jgi:hypothetical protein
MRLILNKLCIFGFECNLKKIKEIKSLFTFTADESKKRFREIYLDIAKITPLGVILL